VAAIVGSSLGLGGWMILGAYSAEYVLLNNSNSKSNSKSNSNAPALDIVSLKTLQKLLPSPAAQILDDASTPEADRSLYKSLQYDVWWQKKCSSHLRYF